MKISIINKLVIGALVATIVTGCGGSGVGSATGLPKGIYVPTFSGHSVRYVSNVNGASEKDIMVPGNTKPSAVATDAGGNLYVGTNEGKVFLFNDFTTVAAELQIPAGKTLGAILNVALDKMGRIYINDYTNHKITRVDDMNGTGWTDLDYLPYLVDINDNNCSLAIDSQNRIYIASRNGSKCCRLDDMTGANPVSFGTYGSGYRQIKDIVDIHIDAQDRIYMADRFNSRIERMDDITGTNWVTFGTKGSGTNQFKEPWQVTSDSSGKVYVSDPINNRMVRINDMTGTGWKSFGSIGNGIGQYLAIMDILVR